MYSTAPRTASVMVLLITVWINGLKRINVWVFTQGLCVCGRFDESLWRGVDLEGLTHMGPALQQVLKTGVRRLRCPRSFVEEQHFTGTGWVQQLDLLSPDVLCRVNFSQGDEILCTDSNYSEYVYEVFMCMNFVWIFMVGNNVIVHSSFTCLSPERGEWTDACFKGTAWWCCLYLFCHSARCRSFRWICPAPSSPPPLWRASSVAAGC